MIKPCPRRSLGRPGDQRQDGAPQQGHQPQKGVHDKTHQHINRCPGRVEQRHHAGPRQRTAHRIKLAQRLARNRQIGPPQRRIQDQRGKGRIKLHPGAHQQPRPHLIKQCQRDQRKHQDKREERERLQPLRRHNAIIDLQHIDRRDDVEQVDERAKSSGGDEMPPTQRKRRCHHGHRLGWRHRDAQGAATRATMQAARFKVTAAQPRSGNLLQTIGAFMIKIREQGEHRQADAAGHRRWTPANPRRRVGRRKTQSGSQA